MLVSTVRARIFWKPCLMASATCTIILESASSWLQGAKLLISWAGEQIAVSPLDTTRVFSRVALATSSLLRSLNNSVLLSFRQRNCFQFLGIGLDNCTRLLWVGPVQRFSLVWGFRLLSILEVLIPHNVYSLSLAFFPFVVTNKHLCCVVTKICLTSARFQNDDKYCTIHDAHICSCSYIRCRLCMLL